MARLQSRSTSADDCNAAMRVLRDLVADRAEQPVVWFPRPAFRTAFPEREIAAIGTDLQITVPVCGIWQLRSWKGPPSHRFPELGSHSYCSGRDSRRDWVHGVAVGRRICLRGAGFPRRTTRPRLPRRVARRQLLTAQPAPYAGGASDRIRRKCTYLPRRAQRLSSVADADLGEHPQVRRRLSRAGHAGGGLRRPEHGSRRATDL